MAEAAKLRIPPHEHCKVCGKAIPIGREICSNECREKDRKAHTRAKRMTRIYTLSFIVLMILIVIFSLLTSRGG